MKKITRYFLFIFSGIIGIVALIFLWFYATCPVYRFESPQFFKGENIYNPYADYNAQSLLYANYQVQSRVWAGITNGRKNSPEAIFKAYRRLGYDIIAISDYQTINLYARDSACYIPVYEHGYGIRKTHQICIGSRRVLWRDYPLGASLSQKQDIINRLLQDNKLIALAHPDLRNGYRFEELKYLSGYHFMEVLNGARVSLKHWDAALSAGYPAFILANDDAHDIYNDDEIGRYATAISAVNCSQEETIRQLKQGNAYGVRILMGSRPNNLMRIMPVLKSLTLKDSIINVRFSEAASEIRFISQGGKVLSIERNSESGIYLFGKKTPYIRIEAEFPGKAILYLNPLVRQIDRELHHPQRAHVDHTATNRKRVFFAFGTLLIIMAVIIKKRTAYVKK